jgi:hypothetical protein
MEKTSSVELLIPPANILFQTTSVPINSSSLSSSSGLAQPLATSTVAIAASTSTPIGNPNQYAIPHLILSPPTAAGSTTVTPLHGASTVSNSLNYVYKIINQGLIEIYERHFSNAANNFTNCSIKIYDILVRYLEGYYMNQCLLSPSILLEEAQSNSNQPQTVPTELSINHLQAQTNPKFFNYYATIRRDIFELLLRIRSDNDNRVLLVNKTNRQKFQQSKYLLLNLR